MKGKDFEKLTTGRLIEAVMRYRGMTVNELADAINYHPMNLYKLLNGRNKITPMLAEKFGKALNMSPLIIMESRNIEIFS